MIHSTLLPVILLLGVTASFQEAPIQEDQPHPHDHPQAHQASPFDFQKNDQLQSQQQWGGSCVKAGLCCAGRDSSCAVVSEGGAALNALPLHPRDRPCYCDHACLRVGDCCHDFKAACEVLDCEVSEWGPWSGCSAECGAGSMVRERDVLRPARGGGAPCPLLQQQRACYAARCDTAKVSREMALLLPGKFAHARAINESTDIRKNLRLKYPRNPSKDGHKEYCVTFEVTKVRKACDGVTAASLLHKGAQVSIGCEAAAMRGHLGGRCVGHGANHAPTRWTFVAHPRCHGRWTRLSVGPSCTPDFIFV